MQIIRGIHNVRPEHRGCVATIGNFDGVHRGHQSVIKKLIELARASGLPATVIVFEPQPREYFRGDDTPPRLSSLRDKCKLLAEYGVERLLVLRFDAGLAALTAAQFIEGCLVNALGIKGLIVGDDFKFGCDRGGDFTTLQRFADQFGFKVDYTSTFIADDERASSTRVRDALMEGDFVAVSSLLGHQYRISGRVVHGNKNGRTMGFPTANLNLSRRRSPLHGIFAVWVQGVRPVRWPGVAYVGTRPIINGQKWVLEVHLLDFDEDCYGRHLCVDFVERIRGDLPFTSFDALAAQIRIDCADARKILAQGVT
ncbi:MAG: bifunctional riboflavin kinase/FAD synthetase [Gammaproteobacteria bacterium]